MAVQSIVLNRGVGEPLAYQAVSVGVSTIKARGSAIDRDDLFEHLRVSGRVTIIDEIITDSCNAALNYCFTDAIAIAVIHDADGFAAVPPLDESVLEIIDIWVSGSRRSRRGRQALNRRVSVRVISACSQ